MPTRSETPSQPASTRKRPASKTGTRKTAKKATRKTAKKATRKKTAKVDAVKKAPTRGRPVSVGRIIDQVKDDTDTPLLMMLAPRATGEEEKYDPYNPGHKVLLLQHVFGITPPILAARLGLQKSTVYLWTSGDMPQKRMQEVAETVGFPMELWYAGKNDFIEGIIEVYPSYRYRGSTGAIPFSTCSTGFSPSFVPSEWGEGNRAA